LNRHDPAATLADMALPLSSSPAAARLPSRVAFQLATSSHEPPVGDGWLFEVKHDGHRLGVIADGIGGVWLLSRSGYERSRHFGPVFVEPARLGRQVVLDGEITAPDDAASPTSTTSRQRPVPRRVTNRAIAANV
jgi:ATP-dependent DNA ligase